MTPRRVPHRWSAGVLLCPVRRRPDAAPRSPVEPIDFPVEPSTASLSGQVWTEVDNDFVRQPSEKPAAGVTLQVSWTGRNGLADRTWTPVTDADGRYALTDLPAGSYRIRLDTSSQTWHWSTDPSGTTMA